MANEKSLAGGREKFGSRLGFILISAGCAIGLGNVYRFPIMVGSYGGALFVLIYIFFLGIKNLFLFLFYKVIYRLNLIE